ncbi:GSU2403 family nucleotidyltransferase fold protein [Flagellatimonas centrodinii]|uniref:GSU2403 family nucleotidyltransferase fold protein n=1 Tax=Flagellatimonas centrodinii TaxID=2806210 RepID=UPI0023BA8940|nr:GSU2403 family nucleotidyltransferase fold protein [Flagellatimonas centrodinii]
MLYNSLVHFTERSTAAQTAYAQLQDAALNAQLSRSVADLRGSFGRKTVKGRGYWYFSFREGARIRQIYVGPDTERVRALIAGKDAATTDAEALQALARAYAGHGGATLLPKHLRLIRRLNDFGFFRVGGVLVGTHAFLAYANLLGVRWLGGDQTMDVDLAVPGKHIAIALPTAPTIDLHDALTSFEAGFIPTQSFTGQSGATYRLSGDPDFQVDVVTTLGREGGKLKYFEALGVSAQPLPFMDYLLTAPVQAVMLDRAGHHVVVNVPSPSRHAVHKLILHRVRELGYRTKANKDLEQAAALFQVFATQDPMTLEAAWAEAWARGPDWRQRLTEGLQALGRRWPGAAFGSLSFVTSSPS